MRRSSGWTVGRVAGTRVVLRPGAVLVVAVIALLFGPTVQELRPGLGASAYLVAAGFGVLLLGSALLHEIAHALVARRVGLQVPEIGITVIGGHTEITGATTPGSDALVAVAGPLTNGIVALVAWAAFPLLPPGVPALLVLLLAYANGFVAVLNLLPGLPLDGGSLLEALVWRLTGRRATGTVVGAWAGRVLAVVLVTASVVVPYATGGAPDLFTVMWAVLIALILWSGAGPFLDGVRREQVIGRLVLAEQVRPAQVVPADVVVADLPEGEVVVVDDDGPLGYVDRLAAGTVPAELRDTAEVLAVLVPVPREAVVDMGLTGRQAFDVVVPAARTSPVLVAVDATGAVRGLIRVDDLVAALRT